MVHIKEKIYYPGDQIEKNGLGGVFDTSRREKTCIQGFVGEI